MKIIALTQDLTERTRQLMALGAPYISARTPSDYWLYARLFSSTCPVAVPLYMALMGLDPTGRGRGRWVIRWKAALNAFDVAFEGRLSSGRN